jgi:hypothetical protein
MLLFQIHLRHETPKLILFERGDLAFRGSEPPQDFQASKDGPKDIFEPLNPSLPY